MKNTKHLSLPGGEGRGGGGLLASFESCFAKQQNRGNQLINAFVFEYQVEFGKENKAQSMPFIGAAHG